MSGWISLHRKILNNPILSNNRIYSRMEAFIFLLLKANHKDNDVVVGTTLYKVNEGSLITSQKKLCIEFKWGNSKLRNFLKLLVNADMIEVKTETKLTRITICNYCTYQNKQIDSKSKTNRKQIDSKSIVNTNNKGNKGNKENNDNNINIDHHESSCFELFWNTYPRKIAKKKCLHKFIKILADYKPEEILDGLSIWVEYWEVSKTEKQFIPHPITFLNQERFVDIPEELQGDYELEFRLDTTGNFFIGFCSGCQTSSFYRKEELKRDSRCCGKNILPDREMIQIQEVNAKA